MKHKITLSLVAAMVASSVYAGAPEPVPAPSTPLPDNIYFGGLMVGASIDNYVAHDYSLMLSYYVEHLYANLGIGYENYKPYGETSLSLTQLRWGFGYRQRLSGNLFGDIGLAGTYGWHSVVTDTYTHPYAIGVDIGLDYQPMRHFQISVRLAPFMFVKNILRAKTYTVFTSGSLTFSYVF